MRRVVLLATLVLGACSADGASLVVDLKTDLVPGIEFVSVETRAAAAADLRRTLGDSIHAVERADDALYEDGVRVAELSVSPGELLIVVELRDASGDVVASRRVRQSVSGTTALTVVITRTCVGATCPGPGDDPSATECAGRRCVPPECVTGEESGCAHECAADTDCPEPAACARAVCTDGACFAASDGRSCPLGAYCDPMLGCVGEPAPADAGPHALDAGPVIGDAGTGCGSCDDGNPCTDDACASGSCTHADNSAPCDDGVFCNGGDACAGGACAAHAGNPCPGLSVCDERREMCTGCASDGDCPGPSASGWSACGGFADTCDESGTQSRDVTSWTCNAGACEGHTSTETQSCTRSTTGASCGTTSYGSFGACGGFAGECGQSGTRSRTVTTYACGGGACNPSSAMESEACTRSTDYASCTIEGLNPCSVTYCLGGVCGVHGHTCGSQNCCEFGCRPGPCP